MVIGRFGAAERVTRGGKPGPWRFAVLCKFCVASAQIQAVMHVCCAVSALIEAVCRLVDKSKA